ncbi:hypothetical protein KW797_01695 [Candidatus Parcubacteria bacterium]|nr:hypothetical protein [Candidatus Parcubacteria bacterium]
MEFLTLLAKFFRDYGPYGVSSIFLVLFLLERRAHVALRVEFIKYIKEAPETLYKFGDIQAQALRRLERALRRTIPAIDVNKEDSNDDDPKSS